MTYGDWDSLVREVSGYDYEKSLRVGNWPLIEVLQAYRNHLREIAFENYRYNLLIAVTAHSKDLPKRPGILD